MLQSNIYVRLGRRAAALLLLFSLLLSSVQAQLSGETLQDIDTAKYLNMEELNAGAFCMILPAGSVTHVSGVQQRTRGEWRDITIQVEAASAAKPMIVFADPTRRGLDEDARCAEVMANSPVLTGRIISGRLKASVLVTPLADNSLGVEIRPGDANLEIGSVSASLRPLFGGKVEVERSRLRLTVVEKIDYDLRKLDDENDDVLRGRVRFGSTVLEISNAQFALVPDGERTPVTLRAARNTGAAFDLELATGAVELFDGVLSSTGRLGLPASELSWAGLDGEMTMGSGTRLVLIGNRGKPTVELQSSRLSVANWKYESTPRASVRTSEETLIDRVSGNALSSVELLAFTEPRVEGLRLRSADISLGGTIELPAIRGAGPLEIKRLDGTELQAAATLRDPQWDASLAGVLGLESEMVQVTVSGPRTRLLMSGQASVSAVRLRNLALSRLRDLAVKFGPTPLAGVIGIPIDVDRPAQSGDWQFGDGNGTQVVLRGELGALRLKGTLWIDPAMPGETRLEVVPSGLALSAAATVTVERALLYGVPPEKTLLGAGVGLSSPEGFVVHRHSSTGSMDVSADVLALQDPALVFSTSGVPRFEVQAPMRFAAGATVRFGLSDMKSSLQKGSAEVVAAKAKALEEEPLVIDDLRLTRPSLKFDRLAVSANAGVGTVELDGLDFDAKSVSHAVAPQWSAEDPITHLDALRADLVQQGDAIRLTGILIRGFDLTAAQGSYISADGVAVVGAKIFVGTVELTDEAVKDAQVAIDSGRINLDVAKDVSRTTGAAEFRDFSVKATGMKTALDGEGAITLPSLVVEHRFGLLEDRCRDRLPMLVDVRLGYTQLKMTLDDGSLSGSASVAKPRLDLKEVHAGSTCTWREDFTVSVASVVKVWECLNGNIFGCLFAAWVDKETNTNVEVSVPLRATLLRFRAGGTADEARVSLAGKDGLSMCLHDTRLTPESALPEVFSVSPDFSALGGDLVAAVSAPATAASATAYGAVESATTSLVLRTVTTLTQLTNIKVCN